MGNDECCRQYVSHLCSISALAIICNLSYYGWTCFLFTITKGRAEYIDWFSYRTKKLQVYKFFICHLLTHTRSLLHSSKWSAISSIYTYLNMYILLMIYASSIFEFWYLIWVIVAKFLLGYNSGLLGCSSAFQPIFYTMYLFIELNISVC